MKIDVETLLEEMNDAIIEKFGAKLCKDCKNNRKVTFAGTLYEPEETVCDECYWIVEGGEVFGSQFLEDLDA